MATILSISDWLKTSRRFRLEPDSYRSSKFYKYFIIKKGAGYHHLMVSLAPLNYLFSMNIMFAN